jgi:lysozyme
MRAISAKPKPPAHRSHGAVHPSKVNPGRKWLFWRYSGSGLSHGVRGRIDLNVFHGDERAWRNWVGGRQDVAEAE